MAVTQNLTVPQNNILDLSLNVTLPLVVGYPEAQPYNITGLTPELVIKASASASDGSGTTYTPTVTSATEGFMAVTIPGTQNATAGTFWWRLDVIDGSGNHVTCIEGQYQVTAA